MADIPNSTQNVTIYDEVGNKAEVNNNNQLLTHDDNVYSDGMRSQYAVKQGREWLVISTLITISGTAETDFLLITNPVASGKIAYLEDVVYTSAKGSGIVRMYRQPTITTNGTAMTVLPIKPTTIYTAVVVAYTAPTISARGTLTGLTNQATFGSYPTHFDLARMIEPGYSTLLTIQPSANNTDHAIFVSWEEQ